MPTTALLIELVIVGFCFFFTLAPFISLIFQVDPKTLLDFFVNSPFYIELLASYPIGIIWNRVCDQIFKKLDERIIQGTFNSRKEYQIVRIEVVMHGETIRDYIGSFRSLIRISRAMSILFFAYFVTLPFIFYFYGLKWGLNVLGQITIILFVLLCSITSVYTWWKVAKGYVSAIHDAYTIILSSRKTQQEEKVKNEHRRNQHKQKSSE